MSKSQQDKDKDRGDVTEEWRRIVKVAHTNGPSPMCDHSAVVYEKEGGKKLMIVFGGFSTKYKGPTNELWEWEMESSTWNHVEFSVAAAKPSPRYGHTACMLGEVMIVFGGYDGTNYLRELWVYRPSTQEWKKVKFDVGPTARCNHAACKVGTDALLIFGGFNGTERLGDLWLLENNRFRPIESSGYYPPERDGCAMAYNPNNCNLYLYGGYGTVKLNDLYELDWNTKVWNKLSNMNTSSNSCNTHKKTEESSPSDTSASNQQTTTQSAFAHTGVPQFGISGRSHHTMAVYNNKIYVFHGFDGVMPISDIYEYDLETSMWKRVEWTTPVATPDLQLERKYYHTTAFVEGDKKAICFGGNDGSGYLNSLWDYEFGEPAEKENVKTKKR